MLIMQRKVGTGTGVNLNNATHDGVSFSVTNEDSFPRGIAFSASGDKMYMLGFVTDTVYQYSL